MPRILIFAAASVTAALLGAAVAQEVSQDPIAERKNRMDMIGDASRTATQMIRGEIEFDPVAATDVFASMNEAITGFGDLFPDGTQTGGETEAAPAIFEDRAGFEERVAAMEEDTATARDAAPQTLEAFTAAFGEVSQNCRACHEDYRVRRN